MTRVKAAEMMGALYEDVEKFFGDIFAWYGRIVARWPLPFILLPMLVCALMGLGLLSIQYETDLEKLYTPIDGVAFKDKQAVQELFPDEDATDFYAYQQVVEGPYAEVIVRPSQRRDSEPNILTRQTLEETLTFVEFVHNVSIRHNGVTYYYRDICATRLGQCVQDGQEILAWKYSTDPESGCVPFNGSSVQQSDVELAKLQNVLSSVKVQNNCIVAETLRLRFSLDRNGTERTDLSLAWEEEFLDRTKHYRTSTVIFTRAVSESLNIELSKPVIQDLVYFAVALSVIMVYATVMGSGGNCVTNHVTLAYAGVMAALMAIVASFGFLSFCGLPFVNICGVMPFMVLGMYVICICFSEDFTVVKFFRYMPSKKFMEEVMADAISWVRV